MPQCFAEPENALQVENWHIVLDFLVIFWLFSFKFFFFRSYNRLFVKNQLIWQYLFDNSYIQRLFLPRYNFVPSNCTYANPILVVLSDFR